MQKSVFEQNVKRWTTLPAGKHKYEIEELREQTDQDCLEKYLHWAKFWKIERGWEHKKYSKMFSGKDVIEVGSGLGYDAFMYARSAKSYTCIDISPEQIEFIKRIHSLLAKEKNLSLSNISYQVLEEPFSQDFGKSFNGFYSHGVFHHVPFETAQKEFANINKFLASGSICVFLMYPKERWLAVNSPSFESFGNFTDGGCPWAEWYDEEKILKLVGDDFELKQVTPWGGTCFIPEFVNFELIKKENK